MKYHIITDSASDITQQEAAKKRITVLPLKTRFGDEEYLDGITITTEQFYERLIESDALPKTSQLPPAEYTVAFENALKECDHVFCITISSKLSGCWQSACIAAEEFKNRVTVIDSENVTIGERNLVDRAIEILSKSNDPAEAAAMLEREKKAIRLIAMLDTLEYLKKGGRISAAAAFTSNLLSIKPVIEIENGEIVTKGKARGSKNCNNLLTQCILNRGPIDYNKPYGTAFSGLSDHLLRKYLQDSRSVYEIEPEMMPVHRIGSTIGTHVGPGAIAASFFAKE